MILTMILIATITVSVIIITSVVIVTIAVIIDFMFFSEVEVKVAFPDGHAHTPRHSSVYGLLNSKTTSNPKRTTLEGTGQDPLER